jgi:parallel beta-helix repeat protein
LWIVAVAAVVAAAAAGCAGGYGSSDKDADLSSAGDLPVIVDSSPGDVAGSADSGPEPDSWSPASDVGLSACQALTPSTNATTNYTAIMDCLNQHGEAQLGAGTYPVKDGIALPAGSKLTGAGSSMPTIRLASGSTTNYLVSTADSARVGFLKLDAAGQLGGKLHSAVVSISGDNTQVDNNEIFNQQVPAPGDHSAGVYVIGDKVQGNVVDTNKIYRTFYGVIFRNGLTKSHVNTVKNNTIFDIKCDGVTFAGYGEMLSNTVYRVGPDCENGPIPGGAVYSLDQAHGGLIEGNTIYDTCGHGIDLDGVSNFEIRNNTVSDPGYQWSGAHTYCQGASGMFIIDIAQTVIENNNVTNHRATNRVELAGDPNNVFSLAADKSFSDLPHQGKQVIAFVLARRRSGSQTTVANTIKGNTFISSCSPVSTCAGMGYFSSRDTGYDAAGSWSASTTNYYTKNNPFGSQVGSKRCGGNWYAANDTCGDPATGDCNTDDYQHNPPTGDWARNDLCNNY